MSEQGQPLGLAEQVGSVLPYLRRYARALTGSQRSGDAFAAATLEALLSDRSIFDGASSPRVALFRAFHAIWTSAGTPVAEEDSEIARRAQSHMASLTPNSREVLLMAVIEGFTLEEVAEVIDASPSEAQELLSAARKEMESSVTGRVLIIEDEAIIALDLQSIVADMGHAITGVARTRDGAVQLAKQEKPDLILSDIQLADNSSGIDAVNDILRDFGDIPVIFITAFPERLLTGDRPEPAFVITKPYSEEQVQSAISQAMFFSSTETLGV
ncbi:response regulator [Mesobacterium pallidum]|uniref:response regulator n=1 Tax=Mesobacterium pallidum TaxID=2872037 RepID=UPI001EE31844|nr:response regulator [Mesobacterium pallidum]